MIPARETTRATGLQPAGRDWWRVLLGCAVAGVALRLLLAIWLPAQPIQDFWSYLARAENLLHAGVYGAFANRPDAAYPPAYPLLLAGAMATGGESVAVAKIVNALLAGFGVVAAGLLARRLAGSTAGLLAAALIAFLPRGLLTSQILASENLLQPLLFGYLWLAAAPAGVKRPLVGAGAAGILLGLATLTRVAAFGLGALWPVAAHLAGRKRGLREGLVVIAVQFLVLVPWAMRNCATLGQWRWLSSTGGINLFIGHHDAATGLWTPWRESLARVVPGLDQLGPFEVDDAAASAARQWIVRHPARAAELTLVKLGHLLFDGEEYLLFYTATGRGGAPLPEVRDVLSGDHLLKRWSRGIGLLLDGTYAVTLLLGVVGLVRLTRRGARAGRRRWLGFLLLAGGAAYFVAVTVAFYAASRYRWPIIDLLTVAVPFARGGGADQEL